MRQEKHFVSAVKSTTCMVPGQLKQIYISLALMKQYKVHNPYIPRKSLRISALDP